MRYAKTTLRAPSPLNARLNQRLSAYVTAASAAGVAMLAAAPFAEAKIVYTPAGQRMTLGGYLPIDINGDGIDDFYFEWRLLGTSFVTYGSYVGVIGKTGVPLVMSSAAALPWGVRIGPKAQFRSLGLLVLYSGICPACSARGPWAGVNDKFLGVTFKISGQTHYGWVHVNVRSRTITGYAYETNANQPILAGEKSGPVTNAAADPAQVLAPLKQPATLGALALGADGLSIWRREDE
jgi:hypothetical protein